MRSLTRHRLLATAALLFLFGFSAVAIAGHDRRPQTDQVASEITFTGAGQDGVAAGRLETTHRI